MTDASVHDSQVFEELLSPSQDNPDVYADSAYRSKQTEDNLATAGYTSHVHERPYRSTPLTETQIMSDQKSESRSSMFLEPSFNWQAIL